MNSIFEILAEQRIVEAMRRGEFDALPGAGRPLEVEDEAFVSPEQRMANRILKNAGFSPREVILRREIAALQNEIRALPDGERHDALRRELALLMIQVLDLSSESGASR